MMNINLSTAARREWPFWILLVAMFAASAVAWDRVTLPIPTHWNIQGEVDGYGGRFEGLLLVPLLATGMYALLLGLPFLDPARANYASFAGPYRVMRAALAVMLAGLHALETLDLYGCGRVTDLGVLAGLRGLKSVGVGEIDYGD